MMQPRVVRAAWYLLVVVPVAIGGAVAAHEVGQLISAMTDMPRVVVPGTGEVALDAGDYTLFGETHSVYNGTAYLAPHLTLRCSVHDAAGAEVKLAATSMNSHYQTGSHSGYGMFTLSVPRAGSYRVVCEGEGGPSTIAFGSGFIGAIIRLVISALGGVFGAILVAIVVYRLRQRARAAREFGMHTRPSQPL